MENEIRIGIGLGNIRFGSSKPAIKKILGEPNEIDTVDVPIDSEEISIEQWHYDELELSLGENSNQPPMSKGLSVMSHSGPTTPARHGSSPRLFKLCMLPLLPILFIWP